MKPCASMTNPLPEPWCGSSKSRGHVGGIVAVAPPPRLAARPRRGVDVHDGRVDPLGDVGEVHRAGDDGRGRVRTGALARGRAAGAGRRAAGDGRRRQYRTAPSRNETAEQSATSEPCSGAMSVASCPASGFQFRFTSASLIISRNSGFGQVPVCPAAAPSPAWCRPLPRRPRSWSSCSPSRRPCRPALRWPSSLPRGVIVGSVPVRTNVLPASGPGALTSGAGCWLAMLTPASASFAMSARLCGSSANARTDAASTGPISGIVCSASTGASRMAGIVRMCRASVAPPSRRRGGCRARRPAAAGRSGGCGRSARSTFRPTLPELARHGPLRPRLLRRDDQVLELLDGEVIQVAEVAHQPLLDQLIDQRLAQPLDVHRGPRREVLEAAPQPRRARGVLAAPDDFVFVADQRAAAGAARPSASPTAASPAGRRLRIGATTRGMTSPAFSMTTVSPSRRSLRARSSALCSVAMEIVEPGDEHRLEHGVRRVRAGPPDVDFDLQQLRVGLLRRELERGRPPRELRRRPELLAQREVVDLDHDAVGVELEVAPRLGPLAAERDQRRRRLRSAANAVRPAGPRPASLAASRCVIFRLKVEATGSGPLRVASAFRRNDPPSGGSTS